MRASSPAACSTSSPTPRSWPPASPAKSAPRWPAGWISSTRTGYELCFVVDFPMYERDEESGQLIFTHNPFSMPQGGLQALETMDPLDILAYQYDIVCNGVSCPPARCATTIWT